MALTEAERDYLRILGHSLQPVVDVGAGGITNSLAKELEKALADHELVKVRVRFGDRRRRCRVLEELAPLAEVCLVQQSAHFALLYRPAPEPVITFPNATTGGAHP
jgi:RNA-binding protein